METEVVMKRKLFGQEIKQKSKSEFFSATDLVRAGNRWRIQNNLQPFNLSEWFRQRKVKEFINELEREFETVKISGRGRGHNTWVHPYLFIDLALALNPKLKIEVYKWLYDELIKYRNDSGDSYKKMVGALLLNANNKTLFLTKIKIYANEIRVACGVADWQKASEMQLKLRNKIHENVALLCSVLKNNDDAIRIGILKGKEMSI